MGGACFHPGSRSLLTRRAERTVLAVLLVVLALGAFTRLSSSAVPRLNVDEGWSYYFCNNPLGEMLTYLQKDRHPPLPYLLLKAGMETGSHDEMRLRLPFAVLGTLNVLFAFLLGRRLFDARIGLGAAALTAVSFLAWEYDTWMRGYVLLTLFSLISTYAYVALMERDTVRRLPWAVAYTVSAALLIYSQYLGVLTLAAHFVMALIHDPHDPELTFGAPKSSGRWVAPKVRLRWLIPCWLGMGLLYLPWLPMLKLQLSRRTERGDLAASGQPFLALLMAVRLLPLMTGLDNLPPLLGWPDARLGWTVLVTVLYGAMAAFGLQRLREWPMSLRLLAALGIPPLLFVALIATKFPELSRIRYYAPYIPYLGMLLTAGLLARPRIFGTLAGLVVVVNLAVLASYLQSPYFRSADWLTPARFIAGHQREAQRIVGFQNHMMHAFNYYYAADHVHYDIRDVDHPTYRFDDGYVGLPQDRVWVEEVASGEMADRLRDAPRVLLILWNDGGSPVRQWFSDHYGVLDGVTVDSYEPDGVSQTLLVQRTR